MKKNKHTREIDEKINFKLLFVHDFHKNFINILPDLTKLELRFKFFYFIKIIIKTENAHEQKRKKNLK